MIGRDALAVEGEIQRFCGCPQHLEEMVSVHVCAGGVMYLLLSFVGIISGKTHG